MADLTQQRHINIEKARNLLHQAVLDLQDARADKKAITPYRRFLAAYDAGLHCALAVLELNRQQIKGEGHHAESFQHLLLTLGFKGGAVAEAKAMSQARNDVTYKGNMQLADEAQVERAIKWAERLINETVAWVQKNHPRVFAS
jgi:hypothetical protein